MKTITTMILLMFNLCAFAGHIKIGDRIVDQWGNPGKVTEVYSNKKIGILLDPQEYVRDLQTLGKAYRCIEGICVGRKVVDQWNNPGKIVEIFDNGMTRIKYYDGRVLSHHVDRLGLSLPCLRDFSCRFEE